MRPFSCIILTILLLTAGLAGAIGRKRPPGRPNVVLILTDDQGWGDLSANKNPWLKTPNMDRLAQQGTSFEHFYVSPLCAPTRASLLTGRYHLSTGVVSVSKGLETMDSEETTLAELFRANGYQTGMFGKWHSGQHYPNRPNDQGFDEFLGFCAGHWSNYFDTKLDHNGELVQTTGYITDVLTDAALKFIGANQDKPFFCYIPYNAPHSPFQVPDAYFNKFKAKGRSNELACVYGMVSNLDDNVGRVLAFLKKRKLKKNTIVIFMTDNGPNGTRYNGDMRGIKGSVKGACGYRSSSAGPIKSPSCRVGQVEHSVTISQPFQAAQLPSPDRVPRKEAYEMADWGHLVIDTFRVPAGKTSIRLKALKIAGSSAAEIDGLRLSFVGN
ncbi:sulfatase-like hydrolase/transferase [Hymenobacter nivis]|uniref:sulfatase-like hydrolase/transferase n=1 Tax=Hymenobacter nivis TaxID=1850093 RepID=UPI001FEAF967|nr:sulfatase-like hydrolase/transferase [Hymenobacter nivis]